MLIGTFIAIGILVAMVGTLMVLPRGVDTSRGDVERLIPGASKTASWYTIAAGVGVVAGLSLAATAPVFQQKIFTADQIPALADDIRNTIAGRVSSAELGDITGRVFLQHGADGTARAVYVTQRDDGKFAVRSVALNPNGTFVGATGPSASVPFFNSGRGDAFEFLRCLPLGF